MTDMTAEERAIAGKARCWKCGRIVRVRKDGTLAKHNVEGYRNQRGHIAAMRCPASETEARPTWLRRNGRDRLSKSHRWRHGRSHQLVDHIRQAEAAAFEKGDEAGYVRGYEEAAAKTDDKLAAAYQKGFRDAGQGAKVIRKAALEEAAQEMEKEAEILKPIDNQ